MAAPLLAWYGDDFTGATDTLATLHQAGLRALLFLGVPDAARRQAAAQALGGPLQAVGIAGAARAMDPAAMEAELQPVGAFFASLRAPVLHYKVCSTFDSAPDIGSIGKAVRVLRRHVANPLVPIVGGQPSLGRYCSFSNLFAAAGRGGAVERIDRHPTMSRHPVTPMAEADLRRHLALQALAPVAAMHAPAWLQDAQQQRTQLAQLGAAQPAAVLLDLTDDAQLPHIGRLLWEQACLQPLLAVGPSSVAQALAAHWLASGTIAGATSAAAPLEPAGAPVFTFAGSLSPVTAAQVRAARSYQPLALSASALREPGGQAQAVRQVSAALQAGRHVLAFTAPADGQVPDTRDATAVAQASAQLVRAVVLERAQAGQPLARVGIAGGDTSSHTALALGLWGLSCRATLGAGVTVSTAHSDDPALDGMALMLKGGQMGGQDVFERLLG